MQLACKFAGHVRLEYQARQQSVGTRWVLWGWHLGCADC